MTFYVFIYLMLGYVWCYWFVNFFLDNQGWDDQPGKVGAFSLILITLAWPVMAALFLGFLIISAVIWIFTKGIPKIYGVNK